MDRFRCHSCNQGFDMFEDVIAHNTTNHSSSILKVRSLELNIQSGQTGYRTHSFNIVPSDIKKQNKHIVVGSDEPGALSLIIKENEAGGNIDVFRSPLHKKSKHSTPNEKGECSLIGTSNNLSDDDISFELGCFSISDDDFDKDLEDMNALLPSVVSALKTAGHIDTWKMFFRLLSERKYPSRNIAYLLFLDTVKWYACENTVTMRYDSDVQNFWRIGYRLFHGKFLRFMGGPKSKGNLVSGAEGRGTYDPSLSKINFAVPFRQVTAAVDSSNPISPSNIKPGVLCSILDTVAGKINRDTTCKICIDGKKINGSTSGVLGDIDLFGFEKAPTLATRKQRLETEKNTIMECQALVANAMTTTSDSSSSNHLDDALKEIIQIFSKRVKDLRQTKTAKSNALEKFKKLSGDNWKESTLSYAISFLTTHIYDINASIDGCLDTIDSFCHALCEINGSKDVFSTNGSVNMDLQKNYVQLKEISIENPSEDEYRYIKQKTEKWLEVRTRALATGSTLNTAVGLDGLKKQVEHFDSVKFGKLKAEPSEKIKEYMEHGTKNEVNALATTTGKFLPAFYPTLSAIEEGCFGVDELIVSPDGSLRKTWCQKAVFGLEIKCPFPKRDRVIKPLVHYSIPAYYVPQLLSEMRALETDFLIYACWTEMTTTFLRVSFDETLWNMLKSELNAAFQSESKRPAKMSDTLKNLKVLVKEFTEKNVEFIAEIKSCKAINKNESKHTTHGSIMDPYRVHEPYIAHVDYRSFDKLAETLHRCLTVLDASYQTLRLKASEFLGFILTDLDRMGGEESLGSVPIAFGLKGYSLPTDSLRNMLEFVLNECGKRGIYVPVCSFDGQWCRLAVRDRNNSPLTILQLQKDVYQQVKKMTKQELLRVISSLNCAGLNVLNRGSPLLVCERKNSALHLSHANPEQRIQVTQHVCNLIATKDDKVCQKTVYETNKQPSLDADMVNEYMSLPSDVNINQPEALERFDVDSFQNLPTEYLESETENNTTTVNIETEDISRKAKLNLSDSEILMMQDSVCKSGRSKKDWTFDVNGFKRLFANAKDIDKKFTRVELFEILKPIARRLRSSEIKVNSSTPKAELVDVLSALIGDGSELTKNTKSRKPRNVSSLRTLSKQAVSRLPKEILCVVYAQTIFPSKLNDWYKNSPYGKDIVISGLGKISDAWYSIPEFNSTINNYLFMILDTYHQLCGLRRLVCKSGIPPRGISRDQFLRVAQENETNGSGFSLPILDLIDKQSCAYAMTTFSEKMVKVLTDNQALREARMVKHVHDWFSAEDARGISAVERCKKRLDFRKWLLEGVNFYEFPPHGSHVNGIPVVLFEGLLTNIERKIQLFTFTKRGCYNVRSIGSLDIENFFSCFQDMDPKGTGVLRPDDIPTAMSVAAEIITTKLDKHRSFHLETTASSTYPMAEVLSPNPPTCNSLTETPISEDSDVWRDLTTITPSDHEFDKSSNVRNERKRTKGTVSQYNEPAKGCRPVREFHRTNETKILPHVRRGLNLDN